MSLVSQGATLFRSALSRGQLPSARTCSPWARRRKRDHTPGRARFALPGSTLAAEAFEQMLATAGRTPLDVTHGVLSVCGAGLDEAFAKSGLLW